MTETITLMEPMLPPRGERELEDLAVSLVEKSSRMAAHIPAAVQVQISELVRLMNCYYSNLIEDHNTHPRDIEKALKRDFSENKQKRDLQLEAKAHIEVQEMIDLGQLPFAAFTTEAVCWVHHAFYERLPDELRWVENPDTGEKLPVVPGQIRPTGVVVGRHIPPKGGDNIQTFMRRFQEAYAQEGLSRLEQVIAVGAAHHRLLWIHPFYDGNGRVTRLISHAGFREAGVGNGLWSISRGLARRVQDYKQRLDLADSPREGDLDGRGTLSQKHLIGFCKFFLETAVDQAEYMGQMLDITGLLGRIEKFSKERITSKTLPKGSDLVLKEALLRGELERSLVPQITGYSDRQARTIVADLVKEGLLGSSSPYGPLSLRFPHSVVEVYFPNLYPPALTGQV